MFLLYIDVIWNNDDWDFYLHVKYFLNGIYEKNSLIDSTFILQGFIGALWAKVFGLSFLNLRILTIIFSLFLLVGSYKLLLQLGVIIKEIQFVALLSLIFNPVIYDSELTAGVDLVQHHMDDIHIGIQYFYNLIGKQKFVGAYCTERI